MVEETRDIAEFLLARIAEDEAEARRLRDRSAEVYAAVTGAETDQMWDSVGDFNPHRLLAECEAKRRIIELHRQASPASVWPESFGPACATCGEFSEYPQVWPCDTLSALAAPYADHPDFDPSWRDHQ